MTTKQILIAARALVEKGWSGRTPARDGEGDGMTGGPGDGAVRAWDSSGACAFDASAAIFRVVGAGLGNTAVEDARMELAAVAKVPPHELCWWNDEVGKAGVLAAYYEAIARLG